jgi:hypothetical protein
MSSRSPAPARAGGRRTRLVARAVEGLVALVLALVLVLYALCRVSGTRGIARVGDTQVAVLVDHLRGETRVIGAPGYVAFVPWLQEVHLLDKRPVELRLEEGGATGPQRGPKLQIRAKDGSSYWFRTYAIQYALDPERAADVLADSGPGDAYHAFLVPTFARSILRDEFGRYGAEEIVLPENLRAATEASRVRLNDALEPHGLRVLELSAPNPAFDPEYEQAIEQRKVQNQVVEYLRTRANELVEERLRRLAEARKESELLQLKATAQLDLELRRAQRELTEARSEADAAYEKRLAAGRARREQKLFEAAALEAEVRADAQGLLEEVQALGLQGERAVREALLDVLSRAPLRLVPPAPAEAGKGKG